jgi:hypothetical protein
MHAAKSDSCHPDDGGTKFLRNASSYKSHREQTPFFIVTAVNISNLKEVIEIYQFT